MVFRSVSRSRAAQDVIHRQAAVPDDFPAVGEFQALSLSLLLIFHCRCAPGNISGADRASWESGIRAVAVRGTSASSSRRFLAFRQHLSIVGVLSYVDGALRRLLRPVSFPLDYSVAEHYLNNAPSREAIP